MSEGPERDPGLVEELQNLGANLSRALRTAWDSPESKRLRDELVTGFNDLSSTIRSEANAFSESDTAQRLKNDVQQVGEKVRSSEVQARVRQELLNVLQNANSELEKVISKWGVGEGAPAEAGAPVEDQPVAPEEPSSGQ